MRSFTLVTILTSLSFNSLTFATPLPVSTGKNVTAAGINYTQLIDGFKKSAFGTTRSAFAAGGVQAFLAALDSIQPMNPPGSIDEATARLQAIASAVKADSSLNFFDYSALLRSANLVDSAESLLSFVSGLAAGENSMSNVNSSPAGCSQSSPPGSPGQPHQSSQPAPPSQWNEWSSPSRPLTSTASAQTAPSTQNIYPTHSNQDAPYSVSEGALRSAIYIPPGFTHGKKPPVILVPGTGDTGYTTFKGNYIPLLQASDFADPVWLNVPGYMLGDAQVSAEYVAYAINYVASITCQNVTVLTWSQGGISTQWAFKYWPSTRKVTSDLVAYSPDFKGTIDASFIAPNGVPLPPSIYQQRYLTDSKFITTLRANNGDSAYVPTTTVYSGFFDEIVEPQTGTSASAYLNDVRHVGVTNSQVQQICSGQLGGSLYTHEGVLYNPLGYALLRDAMKHDGPGQPSRLDLKVVCGRYLTPGLDLGDLLVTENSILVAGLSILLYKSKVVAEPAIKAYAV